MKRVVLESPYAGRSNGAIWPFSLLVKWLDRRANIRYLRACLRDSLERGETPFASHGLYPGALDDNVPEERALGICAGFVWGDLAPLRVVYTDLGVSRGMEFGVARAKNIGQRIEFRTVPGWKKSKKFPPIGPGNPSRQEIES